MPTLVLDLDNTTQQYNGGIADFVLQTEGRSVPPAVRFYSFVDCGWFDSLEHFLDTHCAAVRAGLFRTLQPYPGAPEVLRNLRRDGWTVKIATHRLIGDVEEDIVRTTTIEGLAAAGIEYDELHFVADKHSVAGDVWADDKPEVLLDLDRLGLPRIAYSQLYNQHLPGPHATTWRGMNRLLRAHARRLELVAA